VQQPDRKPYTATHAHTLFRKISDDDLVTMGLSASEAHPAWMILTVLPVPPMPVRPSISVDGGAMRGEDDLTYKLAEIIRANSSLRKFEEEGAPAHVINEFETLLQVRPALPSLERSSLRLLLLEHVADSSPRLAPPSLPPSRTRSLPSLAVAHRDLHGQRPPRPAAGAAEVGPARQVDPGAPQGQGGAAPRQPHGQARRLFGPHRHHGRPQPRPRRGRRPLLDRAHPHLPGARHAVQHHAPPGARPQRAQRVPGRAVRRARHGRPHRPALQQARRHVPPVRLDRRAPPQGRRHCPVQPPAVAAQDVDECVVALSSSARSF